MTDIYCVNLFFLTFLYIIILIFLKLVLQYKNKYYNCLYMDINFFIFYDVLMLRYLVKIDEIILEVVFKKIILQNYIKMKI